jgi:hypothetical protein
MRRRQRMSRFNLEDYETVETRLKRWWASEESKDARIVTYNRSTLSDRDRGIWVFEARIYLTAEDQSLDLPKVTGWASEAETGNQAQWAAELAETSSIGRCLANYSLSGNLRASREEMQKVARASRDWLAEAGNLKDVDAIRLLWADARANGADQVTLDKVAQLGKELQAPGSLNSGGNRGTKTSPAKRAAG